MNLPPLLDLTGMRCPMPVARLRRQLQSMSEGEAVIVAATDPGTREDFFWLASSDGYAIDSVVEKNGVITYSITKH